MAAGGSVLSTTASKPMERRTDACELCRCHVGQGRVPAFKNKDGHRLGPCLVSSLTRSLEPSSEVWIPANIVILELQTV